ncbi:hypothetical protein [Rhodoplanes sp. Z2-YC6860]|uniref:hypothetical protein n=1 Tax=Rhodoplanes sp. Z2-YC6860 TaxID=674703 RepID=UPI00078D9A3C|nr:hypothetical protein [Rhodoplanes sp. Z2-YC6860]AMN40704.1 hypothetical protein RHPLAN_22640 [Rhodoplanes sp. Z2-YC6860]
MYLTRAVLRVVGTLVFMVALLAAPCAHAACELGPAGAIRHVVHIQLDSVQFQRDNPNVPSDLEQMPHLLGFLRDNGTLSTNHHVMPAAQTATNFLTILTGVYGDRMGMPIGDSYKYYKSDGSIGTASSFAYWTGTGGDGAPQMLADTGKTFPAPWVPLTRAGCDVGSFAVPNIGLDGVAVHCARGSAICGGTGAVADVLPDEPGGYPAFAALFGHSAVQRTIAAGRSILDLDGNAIRFPDSGSAATVLNPSASQSLGYAAALLEAGVPVVSVFIADPHEQRRSGSRAIGPGEAGYVAQLAAYDAAFATFFRRLASHGTDPTNTLFVVTAVNSSHFVGGPPEPASCDGLSVPCGYGRVGEIEVALDRMLATQRRNVTTFDIHSDGAPAFYIQGNPGATDPVARTLAQDAGRLTAVNPITGKTDTLVAFLADRAELKLLHMVTASPARTPSFVMFGDADYYYRNAGRITDCALPPACVRQNSGFAWNRGGIQPPVAASWLGMAGPGVRRLGIVHDVFSDHADIRPTTMALLGLKDSYVHDGRVLVEFLDNRVIAAAAPQRLPFIRLARAYKQLNAPSGSLSRNSLVWATRAIKAGDATYADYLSKIEPVTAFRDALARDIKLQLAEPVFAGRPLDPQNADVLLARAGALLDDVEEFAGEAMR